MTAPGGDHGEPYRDQPGRDHPGQPPWQPYQHPPVDPAAPVNYPEYPYPPQQPPPPQQQPPYGPVDYGGPPPPPYGAPSGYGSSGYGSSGYGGSSYGGPPPMYPGSYDPYQGYPSQQTNGLAIASLVASIAGIPLSFLCYLGLPLAIVGIVLGIVALGQVNRTHQQGRGLAIAGIAIGSVTLTLLLISIAVLATHAPTFMGVQPA
jgi:Domain of unknown function (DUF4190)